MFLEWSWRCFEFPEILHLRQYLEGSRLGFVWVLALSTLPDLTAMVTGLWWLVSSTAEEGVFVDDGR